MTLADLIPGTTYAIDHPNWKGLAIYRGIDVFAGYSPGWLCFSPVGEEGKPDGSEGVFGLENVSALAELKVEKKFAYNNPESHRQRHLFLHGALDELVADWISQTQSLPSKTTVLELMTWSAEQTKVTTEP